MPQDHAAQQVQLGQVVLDMGLGTLSRDGQIVSLRSKSFRLLSELARQPGRVVPKQELLDLVWPDVIVTEDSLSQAVRDIRRALGDDTGQILRTVSRRGFMLCPTGPAARVPRDASRVPPLHSWPRIAVLRLDDRTGSGNLAPVLDGLVEEVTAGLARFRNLTVLARHSAFAAGADPGQTLSEIGSRLKADYIVDGSAHSISGALAVSFSLNDVTSGEILWSDRFACEGPDWLTLQDLVPRRIAQRLNSSIEEAGHRRSLGRPSVDLTAFEHLARGRTLFRSYAAGVNERARAHFAAAISADPTMGIAHSFHALADAALHDYSLAPPEAKARFRDEGFLAVDLSPDESRCHRILSYFHAWVGEHELAELSARRAVDLNPSDADALYGMAVVNLTRGRPQDCLDWLLRAKDVNPVWPAYYDGEHSLALFQLRMFAESAQLLSRVPRRSARQEMRLAATYAMAGEPDLARRHVAAARTLDPAADFLHLAATSYGYEHARDRKGLVDAVERALSIASTSGANGPDPGERT